MPLHLHLTFTMSFCNIVLLLKLVYYSKKECFTLKNTGVCHFITNHRYSVFITVESYCEFWLTKLDWDSLVTTTLFRKESAVLNQGSYGSYTSSDPAPLVLDVRTFNSSLLYVVLMDFIRALKNARSDTTTFWLVISSFNFKIELSLLVLLEWSTWQIFHNR